MNILQVRKFYDLTDAPKDWTLKCFQIDWAGRPLLLMTESKPEAPDFFQNPDAWANWYRTPPTAHHLVWSDRGEVKSIRFDRSQGISTSHVQPLGDGWLLVDARGGRGAIHDKHGKLLRDINLGDAIENVQTTEQGKIWVSYFDEGVFGSGIGTEGVVCFDDKGTPIFRFAEFATQHELPPIYDCYAMNVTSSDEVWINYYNEFPMILLKDFSLEQIWPHFGHIGKTFALRDGKVFFQREDRLALKSLNKGEDTEEIVLADEHWVPFAMSQKNLDLSARGAHALIKIKNTIYELL